MPGRLGDCAALMTLHLPGCVGRIALHKRPGDYAALMTLTLS